MKTTYPWLVSTTLVALLLSVLVNGHKRGEEFSYLSMFLERDDNNSELDLDSLYRTYAKAGTKEFSRKRRKLQNNPVAPEKKKPIFSGEPVSASDSDGDNSGDTKKDDDKDKDNKDKDSNNNSDVETSSSSSSSDESTDKKKNKDSSDSSSSSSNDSTTSSSSDDDDDNNVHNDVNDISASDLAEKHGEDIERLTSMLSKLIKQYDVKSIVDVPCRAHAHWMPGVLSSVGASVNFICVDPSNKVLDSVRERLEKKNVTEGRNVRYVQRKFWGEGLPKGDLVVSWSGLDNMDTAHVAKYLRRLGSRKEAGKHKLIVIGSHSGELQKSGDLDKIARFTSYGTPINVRRPPFNLARPARIIKQVATNGNDKQMYVFFQDKLFSEEDE